MREAIHFKLNGKPVSLTADGERMLLWVLLKAGDSPPQGGGEPAIVCMGAVIANAVYDAIGVRLFQLPMTPERIKEAMRHS